MSTGLVMILAGGILLLLLLVIFVMRRRSRKIRPGVFLQNWQNLQKLCASRDTWPLAVINADKLLEQAVKKKRFKGKTMGERLVSAQHQFANNDGVWFAHKLAQKLLADTPVKLREADVKRALVGVRQALRDLEILSDK